MFRLLLIITLLVYLLYKLGLFRVFIGGVNDGYRERKDSQPRGGNVNVDGPTPKGKPKSDFKGGEYIDYEEVK